MKRVADGEKTVVLVPVVGDPVQVQIAVAVRVAPEIRDVAIAVRVLPNGAPTICTKYHP